MRRSFCDLLIRWVAGPGFGQGRTGGAERHRRAAVRTRHWATASVVNGAMLVAIGCDPASSLDRVRVTTGSGVEFAPRVKLQRLTALGHERHGFPVLGHTLPPSAGVDGNAGIGLFPWARFDCRFRRRADSPA